MNDNISSSRDAIRQAKLNNAISSSSRIWLLIQATNLVTSCSRFTVPFMSYQEIKKSPAWRCSLKITCDQRFSLFERRTACNKHPCVIRTLTVLKVITDEKKHSFTDAPTQQLKEMTFVCSIASPQPQILTRPMFHGSRESFSWCFSEKKTSWIMNGDCTN